MEKDETHRTRKKNKVDTLNEPRSTRTSTVNEISDYIPPNEALPSGATIDPPLGWYCNKEAGGEREIRRSIFGKDFEHPETGTEESAHS
jgi:hypothetical protein